jgi:hypothetical protein
MWMIQLRDISDEDLIAGTTTCLRKAKKLPTVANLLDIIEADPRNTVGQPKTIDGCPACYGSGCREMARWFTRRGDLVVFFGLAACDCSKGQQLALGAFQDWRTVRDGWQRDRFTERVYFGTHQQPHLTTEQTITPDELAKRADRAKKMANGDRSTGSWHVVGDSTPVATTE